MDGIGGMGSKGREEKVLAEMEEALGRREEKEEKEEKKEEDEKRK